MEYNLIEENKMYKTCYKSSSYNVDFHCNVINLLGKIYTK